MKRKFSPVQMTYLKAKAAYDTACAAMDQEMKPYGDLLETETGIEEYCRLEELTARRNSRYEFAALLREAEQALIDWSFVVVSKLPQYQDQAAELEPLRTCKRITIREKLVKLAMQLEA